MSVESKAIVREYIERVWNEKKLDQFEKYMAQDIKYHSLPEVAGRDNIKMMLVAFLKAFPDVHLKIEDEFADGDRVSHRYTFSGTFRGEMQGMPQPASITSGRGS